MHRHATTTLRSRTATRRWSPLTQIQLDTRPVHNGISGDPREIGMDSEGLPHLGPRPAGTPRVPPPGEPERRRPLDAGSASGGGTRHRAAPSATRCRPRSFADANYLGLNLRDGSPSARAFGITMRKPCGLLGEMSRMSDSQGARRKANNAPFANALTDYRPTARAALRRGLARCSSVGRLSSVALVSRPALVSRAHQSACARQSAGVARRASTRWRELCATKRPSDRIRSCSERSWASYASTVKPGTIQITLRRKCTTAAMS